MKGLRKVLTPFAPDQSGAVSVLYGLGGLIVIIDAGGCTGNICGFDEPRWQNVRSAVFSAGLRDMDAILGRDKLLVSKIADACKKIDASFVALIGTPVPATIATDYKALKRMLEKEISLPVLTIATDGMRLYDEGEALAYKALADEFISKDGSLDEITLGRTPLTYGSDFADITLEDYRKIGPSTKVTAASASGVEAAKRLGIPYETFSSIAADLAGSIPSGKVLVCHDEVFGKTLRDKGTDCDIATFFTLHDEIKQDGDKKITEEDEFTDLAVNGGYDVIVADESLKPLADGFKGQWIDAPFFALSGRR
ncbi:MAG: nitrogenase molybdenum-iron protein [Saccharofermentans sp.]|nr:nitrogenase molybdenum-iron protein [Saccharofermentans sp.]